MECRDRDIIYIYIPVIRARVIERTSVHMLLPKKGRKKRRKMGRARVDWKVFVINKKNEKNI